MNPLFAWSHDCGPACKACDHVSHGVARCGAHSCRCDGEVKIDLKGTTLVTHAGCMDGSGAAILFIHAGGRREDIRYVVPDQIDELLRNTGLLHNSAVPLLLVDVCPDDPETIAELKSRGNFVIIDHHARSAKHTNEPGFVTSPGNEACGTELFRRWLAQKIDTKFDGNAFKQMAGLIDDHDRWILKYEFSKQMPRFFAFMGQRDFVDRFMEVHKRFGGPPRASYWTPEENVLMAAITENFERMMTRNMKRFHIRERTYMGRTIRVAYIISGEVNCSELLHRYLDADPSVDVAVQINFDLDKVSLRSRGGVDIVEFTRPYGGGGIKTSGGQPLPDGVYDRILEMMHA